MTVLSSEQPSAPRTPTAGALQMQATTDNGLTSPPAGIALINGTQNLCSWTVPPDAQEHRFEVFASQDVTSAETGGAVGVTCTLPDGTVIAAAGQLFPGGSAVGGTRIVSGGIVAAGSTITVAQATALTLGTAKVWAEIWGS